MLRVIGNASEGERKNSYVNLNEALWKHDFGSYGFRIGYQVFNWSDMESFHPADIVNPRFIDSDIEQIKKKGILAGSFFLYTEFGIFKAYVIPRAEFNFFPSSNSRVLGGTRPERSQVVEASTISREKNILQFGGGYEFSSDSFELKVNGLYHVNTSQSLIGYSNYTIVSNSVVPTGDLESYNFMAFDLTASGTLFLGEHTFKFEFLNHSPENTTTEFLTTSGLMIKDKESYLAIGYEYTLSHANGYDSMFLAEYQKSLIGEEDVQAATSIFQNDAFFGYRLTFNDTYGSEAFAGFFYDLSRAEYFYLGNFQRRLNDFWKFKIGYRGYSAGENDDLGLKILENDDEYYLTITRYF